MSITTTTSTNTSFQTPSDVIYDIIGPYTKKLSISLSFDPDDDLTQQEFREESDINTIMARYMKTGQIDFVNKHAPQYGDVSDVDFQTAMETVAKGQSMFADLPADLREKFQNSPAKFLEFIQDEKNAPQAAEMGLLSPEATKRILTPTPEPSKAPEAAKPAEPPAPKKDD